MTRYAFAHAISGFFELPTENARAILPRPLEPVEVHHGSSVLSAAVFDFVDSVVGPYRELVLSVVVAPLVREGQRLPKSAVYPFVLATTTRAARDHAIQSWRLPHWMEDADIDLERGERQITARVAVQGSPVAELTLGEHSWSPVRHLYQTFMADGDEVYAAEILMEGSQSEHEEETGRLVLHEHPLHGPLNLAEVSDVPFREVWMRDGIQTIENLSRLSTS